MFSRILVPVDGSTFSEHALPFAVHAARSTGAALMVVLVHSRQSPVTTDLVLRDAVDAWEDAQVRLETDYLGDLARRIERDLDIS
ncbi:MAG TPA: universal stress protein, partial [Longimicrobiales bacterium]|nr:universal stress protein [Longimicrobiales bacterium]